MNSSLSSTLRSPSPAQSGAEGDISDSQALQELIAILRKPFQSRCDLCRGSGLSGRGVVCQACRGTGRILIDLL